jgi:hypothetical protein
MNSSSNAVGKSAMLAASALVLLMGLAKHFGFTPTNEEVVAATTLLTWGIHFFFPEVDTSDTSVPVAVSSDPVIK